MAEGLPGVVGIIGIENTGLEDAGGALVAEEGVLQALAAFGSFAQLARAEALDPRHLEHVNGAPRGIGKVGGVEDQRRLAGDFVGAGGKNAIQSEAGGDVAFVGRVAGNRHDRPDRDLIPFEVKHREAGAIGCGVVPFRAAVGAIEFDGWREIGRFAEIRRGGWEGEDGRGGRFDREMPPHGHGRLAEEEKGDENDG